MRRLAALKKFVDLIEADLRGQLPTVRKKPDKPQFESPLRGRLLAILATPGVFRLTVEELVDYAGLQRRTANWLVKDVTKKELAVRENATGGRGGLRFVYTGKENFAALEALPDRKAKLKAMILSRLVLTQVVGKSARPHPLLADSIARIIGSFFPGLTSEEIIEAKAELVDEKRMLSVKGGYLLTLQAEIKNPVDAIAVDAAKGGAS